MNFDLLAAADTLRKLIPLSTARSLDDSPDVLILAGDGDEIARVKGNLALGVSAAEAARAFRIAAALLIMASKED